jgi:hypothetical protein
MDDDPDLDDIEGFVLFAGSGLLDDEVLCATCGKPLGNDPEDEPEGDAGLPICGECNRSRNFDALEEQGLDTQDR